MFRGSTIAASVCWFALAATAIDTNLLPAHSFGHESKLSPNGRAIPNWHLTGDNHVPQLLSDRIVLTPPAPGHARGAIWADNSNPETEWSAKVMFRAGGQERGSGDLQIWYVKDGRSAIEFNNIYTIPKFEGLVLTVDQHGGRGGMLRAFLNDGSANFKDNQMVDNLAFGHCDFVYRNLGRQSEISVSHDRRGLEVKVDGKHCFSSDKISLPSGYFFGVTATTSDNPDSFEVSSFLTTKTTNVPAGNFQEAQKPRAQPHVNEGVRMPNAPEQIPDRDANAIEKQEEQFADLHNRLQGISHQVNNMFAEFDKIAKVIEQKQGEILTKIPQSSDEKIMALGRRIENIEQVVRSIERDVAGRDYSTHLKDIHKAVEGVKGGLSENLPDTLHHIVKGSAPKVTTFVFIVIAVQVMLLGLYIVYRKRRDSAPKKYL